jgi:hypothetical protein
MKKLITLGIALAMLATMILPVAASASNTANQNASTTSASTISIVLANESTAVSTITFPAGAPNAVISNPVSNTDALTQTLNTTDTLASPVAFLKSTSDYIVWYKVTAGTGWATTVASESFVLIAKDAALDLDDFAASDTAITVWNTATVTNPAQNLVADTAQELYLQITLQGVSGKTGESTLEVLGETP